MLDEFFFFSIEVKVAIRLLLNPFRIGNVHKNLFLKAISGTHALRKPQNVSFYYGCAYNIWHILSQPSMNIFRNLEYAKKPFLKVFDQTHTSFIQVFIIFYCKLYQHKMELNPYAVPLLIDILKASIPIQN